MILGLDYFNPGLDVGFVIDKKIPDSFESGIYLFSYFLVASHSAT